MQKLQKNIKPLVLTFFSILFLGIGFYNNCWKSAAPKQFFHFQNDSESLILGRLAKSQQDGIFSSGGLTGWADKNSVVKGYIHYQYQTYEEKKPIREFHTYKSQPGFQAVFFAFLDKITNFSNRFNISLFRVITSLLSATALSLIILWFYLQYGFSVSAVVLLTSIYSQWLTLFGRNLWWVIWAFYVPMISVLYWHYFEEKKKALFETKLIVIVFFAVILKCLFNGYEYITTTLIMMITPCVYYAIYKEWTLAKFIRRIFFIGSSAVSAVLVTLGILAYQISLVEGGMVKGIRTIVFSLGKRSYGDIQNYPDVFKAGLQSNLLGIIEHYLNITAIDLRNLITFIPSSLSMHLNLKFYELILVFAICTAIAVLLSIYGRYPLVKNKRTLTALIYTTWFSILAPISWFTIFKAHSYVHIHMNAITWHMPFTLFGFALCGVLGRHFFCVIVRNREPRMVSLKPDY